MKYYGSILHWFWLKKEYLVALALYYANENIDAVKDKFLFSFNLIKPYSFFERILRKIRGLHVTQYNHLSKKMKDHNPALVVISQGGNIAFHPIIKFCKNLEISFVIITQLVTKLHLLDLNAYNYGDILEFYTSAHKNYFVSLNNLHLHNTMLG